MTGQYCPNHKEQQSYSSNRCPKSSQNIIKRNEYYTLLLRLGDTISGKKNTKT